MLSCLVGLCFMRKACLSIGDLEADELWTTECNLMRDMFGLSGIDPEWLLTVFLPALLFESACLGLDFGIFKMQLTQILLLAFPAMVVASGVTGALIYVANSGEWNFCEPLCPVPEVGTRSLTAPTSKWCLVVLTIPILPTVLRLQRTVSSHSVDLITSPCKPKPSVARHLTCIIHIIVHSQVVEHNHSSA